MPYTKEHKQETHERILRTAARALRRAGIGGVGIGALMAQAGLTHGGFYAHFPSKDVLVAEACAQAMTEAGEALFAAAEAVGQTPNGQALRQFIRAYLSRAHRDAPETGCALPALAADVARAPDGVRRAFTAGLADYLRRLEALMPTDGEQAPRDAALALLSGMVGALLLSRAVDDAELSDRFLAATRAFYTSALVSGGNQDHAAGSGYASQPRQRAQSYAHGGGDVVEMDEPARAPGSAGPRDD